MEKKNATETNTVDKAEPPASAAMITVDVDREALNCPRCLQPLTPPVFQVCPCMLMLSKVFFAKNQRYNCLASKSNMHDSV
jgi:hypothetical protein